MCAFQALLSRSGPGKEFQHAEYLKHKTWYPNGVPSYGEIVDAHAAAGKPKQLKFKFWLWTNGKYGAHTDRWHIFMETINIHNGLPVDLIMEKCWPKLALTCDDPTIKVCDYAFFTTVFFRSFLQKGT